MQLNYKSFGTGDPVIILHGLFGMLDNWQTIAKQLAKTHMVFIVDLRNHGRSPHHEEFSYSIMANDVIEFMESHWIYEAHIVGHSMGGKVAMQMALESSSHVQKLTIVDIAPVDYVGNHEMIFKAMFETPLQQMENRKAIDSSLSRYIDEIGIRQFLLKNIYTDKEAGHYKWRMNLEVLYREYQNILKHQLPEDTFDGETLFIRGKNSDYILDNYWQACLDYFPNANLQTVENSGHWVHAEQPKSFFEKLSYFLND